MATIESLYKQMMHLHQQIAPESYFLERNYKKYIKEKLINSLLLEYKIGDDLIGMAVYYIHTNCKRKTLVITDFVIDAPSRGKGHGSKMLKKLHAIAKSKKCKQIQLTVASENKPAKTLYESRGYKPTAIRMYKEI